MGQAVAQTTMPAAGGQWEVDGSEPSDVMIGPLGVANNYEILNKGPSAVAVSVCNADGTTTPGPNIPKGETRTVGAQAGGSIKGMADGEKAKGTYLPEA
jgi:hypothetical protein